MKKKTADQKEVQLVDDPDAPEKPRKKKGFFQSKQFKIAFNFSFTVILNFAALASVTTLIFDEPELWKEALKFFGFLCIIFCDIASEIVILVTHDFPLIAKSYGVYYIDQFIIARYFQLIAYVAWLITFACMVWKANLAYLTCTDTCTYCYIADPTSDCSSSAFCNTSMLQYCNTTTSSCYWNASNPTCSISNSGNATWTLSSPINTTLTFISSTTNTNNFTNYCNGESRLTCLDTHASSVNCVLLAIVLLDMTYQMMQLYLRSFIYPITIPESVMFEVYLNWDTKKEAYRHKLIVAAVGKMEFGTEHELKHVLGHAKSILSGKEGGEKKGGREDDSFERVS